MGSAQVMTIDGALNDWFYGAPPHRTRELLRAAEVACGDPEASCA